MTVETSHFDLYMRHTDTNGKSVVMAHRVWDKDRFIQARTAEAQRENAKAREKGAPALAGVQQITEAQYKQERRS